MDIHELESCYYIQRKDIQRLETLGLLDNVSTVNGEKDYSDNDVHQLLEMIHLINLGFDDHYLIDYYNKKDIQIDILKKVRSSIFK